jgi:hypothetical protein
MANRRRQGESKRRCVAAAAVCLGLSTLGCGEGFDPPSELKTLRVLGVHKNESYADAGSEVTLNLIWQDASPKAPRDVVIGWLPPCFNPPGDLYYGCFEQFQGFDLTDILTTGSLSQEFSFRIPRNIVAPLPAGEEPDVYEARVPVRPPPDPDNPTFGTTFAFFIACAGTPVVLDPPPSGNALPLGCRDAEGDLVGPDDFTAGYTTIYSFEDSEIRGNQKPVITGFQVEGAEVPVDCLGAECAREGSPPEEPAAPIDCETESARCVATCEDDGESECPEIDLRPLIDPSVAESDQVSVVYYGRNLGEQMWVNYYVDRGGVRSPVRLLNDANTGWNDDYGVEFYAPKEPGPFSVWAVSHDNRGGADFVRVRLHAQ